MNVAVHRPGEVRIDGYRPGAIGRITELHAAYYSREWEFGAYFEARVAAGLAEFMQRFDARRDGIWTACIGDSIEGALTVDALHAEDEGAHLRWFILSDRLRGQGVGNRLMQAAIDHCRAQHVTRVFLSTFEGLHAARHLYEKFGFRLEAQSEGSQWGVPVQEQRFALRLAH